MVTPTKFAFLQKILQKHQHEVETSEELENSPQKPKWMKRLNIMSPSKIQAPPPSPVHVVSPEKMNRQRQNGVKSVNRKIALSPRRQQPILTLNNSLDVVDLEKVITDFETDYLSPTKRNSPPENSSKFVRKMVAIFEKKTIPTYRDPKNFMGDLERRKSTPDIFRETPIDYFVPMDNTYVIERHTKSLDNSLGDCLRYTDISKCREALDEGISDESIEWADEAIETSDESLYDYPPARSDASLKRERAPKIIGAFLKEPIEVDNTAIDWLPTPATKLPRKKSFTKFFSLLSGKKIWDSNNKNSLLRKKSQKESRETHDSGYDEKSISPTSSLQSTSSFTNTLNEKANSHDTAEQVTRVSTFMSQKSPQETDVEKEDVWSDNHNTNDNKKMMFEEIPRSEVRLSLGPFFPIQPKLFIKSLDRQGAIKESNQEIQIESTYSNTNKYQTPSLSSLPKHPFISEDEGSHDSPITPFDDDQLNQVELRRAPKWKFPSSDDVYDVPRYISTSEPGSIIDGMNKRHTYDNSYQNMIIYDVPRIFVPPRPKSSVYEDCQSLRRRTAGVDSIPAAFQEGYYDSPTVSRSQFATIKPRNSMLLRNREFVSIERFKALHTLTVPNIPDYTRKYSDATRF